MRSKLPCSFKATITLTTGVMLLLCSSCGAGNDNLGDTCGDDPPVSEEASPNNACRALIDQCPHRGGDLIHNICADGLPPNYAWDHMFIADYQQIPSRANPPGGRGGQGCDVGLAGRSFDAISWDSVQQHPYLWEVKTDDVTTKNVDKGPCRLNRFIKLYIDDCSRVVGCNKGIPDPLYQFHYRMAFSDEWLFSAMNDYFASHPADLPAGASMFCEIYSAQGCRN